MALIIIFGQISEMKRLLLFAACCFAQLANAQSFFHLLDPAQLSPVEASEQLPTTYQAYTYDRAALAAQLQAAPDETQPKEQGTPFYLPLPDGHTERFWVWKVPVLADAVAESFAPFHTFAGQSLDHPHTTLRGSLTVRGLRVTVFGPQGQVAYIEPYTPAQPNQCIVYDQRATSDAARTAHFGNGPLVKEISDVREENLPTVKAQPRGALLPLKLRTLRWALACTGEFAQDHGGTKESAFAAFVEYTNQMNAIFERDMALRFLLLGTSIDLVHLDGATDPYPGPSPSDNAGPNSLILNSRLGTNTYDIGHVLMRGGGGVSLGLGIACKSNKGGGATAGRGRYGNPFVGVLCQEVGHQLAANHTWSRCGGFAGDQRNGNTAVEPGSGSTIMSYAGGCGTDNIQGDMDLYFNAISIDEMQAFFTSFSTCGQTQPTTNNNPIVTLSYRNNFFIPIGTPFELTGSATDPDGDALTYCWEAQDYGVEAPLGQQVGNSALFRSLPPVTTPTRFFPRLQTVLNNLNDPTEVLPNVARRMVFRLTARDNRAGGGGIGFADVSFRATDQAGPFRVTFPNSSNAQWTANGYATVTWSVANTDGPLVNCKTVNIRLSTDGGLTWPTMLAAGVQNLGRASVLVPDIESTTARVRVEAAENIFYDVSNQNFTIVKVNTPFLSAGLSNGGGQLCLPAQFTTTIHTRALNGFANPVRLELLGNLPAGTQVNFSQNRIEPNESSTLRILFQPTKTTDTVRVSIRATALNTDTLLFPITLILTPNDLSGIAALAPSDGATNLPQGVVLKWRKVPDARTYDVQLATSATFASDSLVATLTNTTLDTLRVPKLLEKGRGYYWRVRGNNACGNGTWTETAFFSIFVEDCKTLKSTALPQVIRTNDTNTVRLVITVPTDDLIKDLNLRNITCFHEFWSDLELSLVGPDGTTVRLFRNIGCNTNGTYIFGFDDESPFSAACFLGSVGQQYKPIQPLTVFREKSTKGAWTLVVRDNRISSGGRLNEFSLEYCGPKRFSQPLLVRNEPLRLRAGQTQPITPDLLKVSDGVTAADKMVFTLLSIPTEGQLYKANQPNPLRVGDTFTQADVDEGKIGYTSEQSQPDGFRFVVSNGGGGYLGTPRFRINPEVVSTQAALDWQNTLRVYPNPSSGQLQLAVQEILYGPTFIDLLDAHGRLVYHEQWPIGNNLAHIDASALPTGLYIVQVRSQAGVATRKIVLER